MEPKNWLTRAEATSFQETSRYPEVIHYCKKLQEASPLVRYTTFGVSPEGRELPLLIVSKDQLFTSAEAGSSGSVILLILNGIHPGEIAGKDASLMLIRDLVITREKFSLLDKVILLVIPIYNVDGHERFGPNHRINQNGPREMGWRTNSQNLNLNRDWIKAESQETRAVLRLFASWLPDFLIDNHVSDGADFQYDVTWLADDHPGVAEPVRKYFTEDFEPYLISSLSASGHVVSRYFELKDPNDPAQGILMGPFAGRYSNGYCTLQNRPSLVVETHMLKSFEARIRAHYDLMEAVLRKFNSEPDPLRNAVRKADQETLSIQGGYPIRLSLNQQKSEAFLFRGVEARRSPSSVSGKVKITYASNPLDFIVPFCRSIEPEIVISPPLGYGIPPQWTFVIERLGAHQVRFQRLGTPVTSEFETYHFTDIAWEKGPFEGHHMVRFKTVKVTERRTLEPGSVIIWLNQRMNKVILELLEPDAMDSLVSWGYFNAIFEEKESPEDFILEKLADEMLQRDLAIRNEFQEALAADPAFAANPTARLRFFFERSPYRDERKDNYPLVRITDASQVPVHE